MPNILQHLLRDNRVQTVDLFVRKVFLFLLQSLPKFHIFVVSEIMFEILPRRNNVGDCEIRTGINFFNQFLTFCVLHRAYYQQPGIFYLVGKRKTKYQYLRNGQPEHHQQGPLIPKDMQELLVEKCHKDCPPAP